MVLERHGINFESRKVSSLVKTTGSASDVNLYTDWHLNNCVKSTRVLTSLYLNSLISKNAKAVCRGAIEKNNPETQ